LPRALSTPVEPGHCVGIVVQKGDPRATGT
jgi:hypothetical protein